MVIDEHPSEIKGATSVRRVVALLKKACIYVLSLLKIGCKTECYGYAYLGVSIY